MGNNDGGMETGNPGPEILRSNAPVPMEQIGQAVIDFLLSKFENEAEARAIRGNNFTLEYIINTTTVGNFIFHVRPREDGRSEIDNHELEIKAGEGLEEFMELLDSPDSGLDKTPS